MAFITDNSSNVLSFAEYQDVLDADQRVFENNEGLTDDIVEDALTKATQRILTQIKYSDWWRDLYLATTLSPSFVNADDVPDIIPKNIIARQQDFTDLCVFYSLYYYLLPKVADFSKEDNAERAKIGFYQAKFQLLFTELINNGDWYDVNADGNIAKTEKRPGNFRLHRVR
jgi:hypothetical protein